MRDGHLRILDQKFLSLINELITFFMHYFKFYFFIFFYPKKKMEEKNDRKRLIDSTNKLEKIDIIIEKSLKTIEEIDDTSIDTLERLKQQKDRIKSTINKTKEIQSDGSQSSRIVTRTLNRQITNKAIIVFIIILLIIAILGIIIGIIYPFVIDPLLKKKSLLQ